MIWKYSPDIHDGRDASTIRGEVLLGGVGFELYDQSVVSAAADTPNDACKQSLLNSQYNPVSARIPSHHP